MATVTQDPKRRPRMGTLIIICNKPQPDGTKCRGRCFAGSSRPQVTWYLCSECKQWKKVERPNA